MLGTVFESPLAYFAIAATGPVAATIAENPAVFFQGTAASILGAVGLAIWRCAALATKFLEGAVKHQEAEVKAWEAEAAHRALETLHWNK